MVNHGFLLCDGQRACATARDLGLTMFPRRHVYKFDFKKKKKKDFLSAELFNVQRQGLADF